MDDMTPHQRHTNMQHIKSVDTSPEIIMRKLLWKAGIRYRKNYKGLPGTPDIVLTKSKIAIFIDGDFWHGRYHEDNPGAQVKTNKAYWTKKLSRNIERDKEVNDQLLQAGWLVLRFWESDVKTNPDKCIDIIKQYLP